jgi:hypothetical protein
MRRAGRAAQRGGRQQEAPLPERPPTSFQLRLDGIKQLGAAQHRVLEVDEAAVGEGREVKGEGGGGAEME